MDYPVGTEVLKGGRVGFLLMHGLGGSPVEMRFLAQSLNKAGHTVVLPLMAGHGGTPAEFEHSRWTEWCISAELALDRMHRDCDTIIVGGISAGAIVALRLAATRKDLVQGVAVFSPTFWPNGWAIPRVFNLFKLVTTKWCAGLFTFAEKAPYGIKDDRTRKLVLDSLTSEGKQMSDIFTRTGSTLLEFRWLAKDVKARLGEITQPAFVVHPREDDQSDLSNAMLLLRRMKGRVESIVLEDSYHMVVLDRQRHLVADRTAAFARTLEAEIEAATEKQRWRSVGRGG